MKIPRLAGRTIQDSDRALFQVRPNDGPAFVGASLVFGVVAVVACLMPA